MQKERLLRPVFLIGFMGSGKTSVGKALARLADMEFLDTDEMIVEAQQMPITQIFAEQGETYFRDLETQLLRDLEKRMITENADEKSCGIAAFGGDENRHDRDCSSSRISSADSNEGGNNHEGGKREKSEGSRSCVISVGGGMPMREENRAIMRRIGTVIYLKAEPDTLVQRLSGDTTRPLLQGGDLRQRILTLMEKRGSIYAQASHIQLYTDGMSVQQAARSIARQLKNS